MTEIHRSEIVVFPAGLAHNLPMGGDPTMEIKHTHPGYPSRDKRAEALKMTHRSCLALLAAARNKEVQRGKRGA